MMKTKAQFAKPDDAVVTISITGTVAEFRRLKDQLPEFATYPSCELARQIYSVVSQIELQYYALKDEVSE